MSITNNNDEVLWAQSCITSIGFPDTLDGVLDMVDANEYKGSDLTDMDCILQFHPADGTAWSAPKWLTQDDILFFYHTKRGGLNASRLRNLAKRLYPSERRLVSILEHAAELAKQLAGSIFACSAVSGSTEYMGAPEKHFDGRLFAPLGKVHIFARPLRSETFADFVKIGQTTITPVYTREALGIRSLLAQENSLPRFLTDVEFGDNTFRNVDKDNWAEISCLPGTRFIHEAQLRSYMLDYFLSRIKDKGTAVLEECQCFSNGQGTGIADNFVKIDGLWVPCEAKLSILSERDIFTQVAKYMAIDEFSPTRGPRRTDRFKSDGSRICLVVDQSGLYIIAADGNFLDCGFGEPLIKREYLGQVDPREFRNLIRKYQ